MKRAIYFKVHKCCIDSDADDPYDKDPEDLEPNDIEDMINDIDDR